MESRLAGFGGHRIPFSSNAGTDGHRSVRTQTSEQNCASRPSRCDRRAGDCRLARCEFVGSLLGGHPGRVGRVCAGFDRKPEERFRNGRRQTLYAGGTERCMAAPGTGFVATRSCLPQRNATDCRSSYSRTQVRTCRNNSLWAAPAFWCSGKCRLVFASSWLTSANLQVTCEPV